MARPGAAGPQPPGQGSRPRAGALHCLRTPRNGMPSLPAPKTSTALDDDPSPVPRGDGAGPGLEMTLTPNLQGLPTAHGYFPTRPSAPPPSASPQRPGIFTHQQPLPVQAPGVSTRLSLSKHPLSLAPKTQKPHTCGSGLGGPGPNGGGLSL